MWQCKQQLIYRQKNFHVIAIMSYFKCLLCRPRTIRRLLSSIPLKIHRNCFTSQVNSFRKREWISSSAAAHEFTSLAATPFTLMSYNILSQTHLQTHQTLYADHDATALHWPHRLHRISTEIVPIAPDILCLQEVERDHLPEIGNKLSSLMYSEPLYKKRSGNQIDGCAIFYNSTKFRLIESHSVDYYQPGVHVSKCHSLLMSIIIYFCFVFFSDIESMQCGHCRTISTSIESEYSICCRHNAFAIQSETHRYPFGSSTNSTRRIASHCAQRPTIYTDYTERRFQCATAFRTISLNHWQQCQRR